MLSLFLYKCSLFLLGFNLFLLTRYTVHILSIKHTFRHVPGPDASSRLWGEEWELFHSTPGVRYIDWHVAFGKIVGFNGAFGVRNTASLQTSTKSALAAQSTFHHGPQSSIFRSWRGRLQISKTPRSSRLVSSFAWRGHTLG